MPRPKKVTVDTHARLPLGLYQMIRALAEESNRSIQEEITLRLQHSVNTTRRISHSLEATPCLVPATSTIPIT